jgi:Bacterial PH domain
VEELFLIASAWIENPVGRYRELRVAAGALDPDEEVELMLDLFRGGFVGRSGILLVTKRRLMFARAFFWRTKIEAMSWSRVRDIRIGEVGRSCDLTVESDTATWNFWIWGSRRNELRFLYDGLQKRLAEEHATLQQDNPSC